jgi:heme/copper-type cytochrome/quinol oxidase subunit 2
MMILDSFWSAVVFVLTITGALTWGAVFFLIWFHWMCSRPPKE